MEMFEFIVKNGNGKISKLDKDYKNLISEIVSIKNDEHHSRWETYNLIIKEFLNIDNGRYFEEIKYRLTDGENPNIVMLDVISRYNPEELTWLIWVLKSRVEDYQQDDFYGKFIK